MGKVLRHSEGNSLGHPSAVHLSAAHSSVAADVIREMMVRPITDPELLKKKYPCGVGGCQEVVSHELEDRANGLWGYCCQTHATLQNLGVNLKELHEEAIRKMSLPSLPSV